MTDGRTNKDDERTHVTSEEEEDGLQAFADRYDISLNQARALVSQFGFDRDALQREARKISAS